MELILQNSSIGKTLKVLNDRLVTGEIINRRSKQVFVPDGNGAEFSVHMASGDSYSSKTLMVDEYEQSDGKIVIAFAPNEHFKATLTLTLGQGDFFIKKRLSLEILSNEVIDYVQLESVGLSSAKSTWAIKGHGKALIDECYAILGQPFYVDSLFFGCEFPLTENIIDSHLGVVNYYYGKNTGVGTTLDLPPVVIGAARSAQHRVVAQDFLHYIKQIATPSHFVMQYNSWYDHMLNITGDGVLKSFYEVEKGLTQNGVPPVDAYVLDDGWNDYKGSFWGFNKKFPNELYDLSNAAKKMSSDFGLWFGPRGGYVQPWKFAKRIERAGNGYYNRNAHEICVGSQKYISKSQALLLDYVERFNISYLKLDGFMIKSCYSKKHDHIVGGKNNMYLHTEMWEGWIEVFKALRAKRAEKGLGLWINLTCHVNPSPWWLQYVNSVWLQNSADHSFAKNVQKQSQLDSMLSYRDGRYFNFVEEREQQFPLASIYNHEPVYGVSANVSFTDDEFEKYLFMNAARGTAFWELYYSYSIMNDAKWQINAKVLHWAKKNHHILKNTVLFGTTPEQNGVYGYSAWNGSEGIVTVRNPSDKAASYTLVLDRLVGVGEDVSGLSAFNVYGLGDYGNTTYSYADEIVFSLKPFEMRVLQFGKSDNRFDSKPLANGFTISFTAPLDDCQVLKNDDVVVEMRAGKVHFAVGNTVCTAVQQCSSKLVSLVREKNGMIKIYVDGVLDSSSYDAGFEPQVSIDFADLNGAVVQSTAKAYNEVDGRNTKKPGFFKRLFKK